MLAAEHMAPAGSLCGGLAAPCPPSPAAPARPALSAEHLAFLRHFQAVLGPKLQQLVVLLSQQEVAKNLSLVQIWTYIPVLLEGRQLLKAHQACLLADPALLEFHNSCVHEGVSVTSLGPMGKVWEAGAVKVVQDAQNLPEEAHPCTRLHSGLAQRVGEVVYLPIYELKGGASTGVVAVLEVMMRSSNHDPMVVANTISTIAHILDALQLSLSNPAAQQQQQQQAQAHAAQARSGPTAGAQANQGQGSAAAGMGPAGAGRTSSMARTMSMRYLLD